MRELTRPRTPPKATRQRALEGRPQQPPTQMLEQSLEGAKHRRREVRHQQMPKARLRLNLVEGKPVRRKEENSARR